MSRYALVRKPKNSSALLGIQGWEEVVTIAPTAYLLYVYESMNNLERKQAGIGDLHRVFQGW